MKLSTRIKREIDPDLVFGGSFDEDYAIRKIVLMVDCKRTGLETYSMAQADEYHRHLVNDGHCTLLHDESPVVNGRGEIIYHYTSTTHSGWCKSILKGA